MTARGVRTNFLLVLGSICLSLLLAELALRIAQPGSPVHYAVWPPGLEQVIIPDAQDTPGISETYRFRVSAQGYRGRGIANEQMRIAAFGGSTTESLFVRDALTWPHLIEDRLARTLGVSTWVGNFGKSGRNTRQHVLDAMFVLPQFRAQIALFLVGVNDLGVALINPAGTPMSIEQILSDEYLQKSLVVSETHSSPVRLLGLVRDAARSVAHRVVGAGTTEETPHITTKYYRIGRERRAVAVMTSVTPHIGSWLDEYGRNLAKIADLVRRQGALPVFISQPTSWSAAVPGNVEALFWWGGAGEAGPDGRFTLYYSSEAMGRMMELYNERLRSIARDNDVPLIDAAQKLTKDPSYFYDEMHYNEAGSRAIADIISQELATIIKEREIVTPSLPQLIRVGEAQ
jgi:lysophospholipase L1-like esterase